MYISFFPPFFLYSAMPSAQGGACGWAQVPQTAGAKKKIPHKKNTALRHKCLRLHNIFFVLHETPWHISCFFLYISCFFPFFSTASHETPWRADFSVPSFLLAFFCPFFCVGQHRIQRYSASQRRIRCIRQHTSAYVSIRQHTSAYVSYSATALRDVFRRRHRVDRYAC